VTPGKIGKSDARFGNWAFRIGGRASQPATAGGGAGCVDFKVELRGDGDSVVAPNVPLNMQASVPHFFTLGRNGRSPVAGGRARTGTAADLDDLARIESVDPIGAWRLDSQGHREIKLRADGHRRRESECAIALFAIERRLLRWRRCRR